MDLHASIAHSFLQLRAIPSCGYTTLAYHSPVDEHLGCFQFGAITEKAALNIQTHLCKSL